MLVSEKLRDIVLMGRLSGSISIYRRRYLVEFLKYVFQGLYIVKEKLLLMRIDDNAGVNCDFKVSHVRFRYPPTCQTEVV